MAMGNAGRAAGVATLVVAMGVVAAGAWLHTSKAKTPSVSKRPLSLVDNGLPSGKVQVQPINNRPLPLAGAWSWADRASTPAANNDLLPSADAWKWQGERSAQQVVQTE